MSIPISSLRDVAHGMVCTEGGSTHYQLVGDLVGGIDLLQRNVLPVMWVVPITVQTMVLTIVENYLGWGRIQL